MEDLFVELYTRLMVGVTVLVVVIRLIHDGLDL